MRHPHHDYSANHAYFVTFATHERRCFLSILRNGETELTPAGQIAYNHWNKLPNHFPGLIKDAIVVMPDHIHAILLLTQPDLSKTISLPKIMHGWKTYSANEINKHFGTTGTPVWQAGYHDRVIRTDAEMEKYRYYILTNPQRFLRH